MWWDFCPVLSWRAPRCCCCCRSRCSGLTAFRAVCWWWHVFFRVDCDWKDDLKQACYQRLVQAPRKPPTLRAIVHIIISTRTVTTKVQLQMHVCSWAGPRSKVYRSLLRCYLSSGVAVRICSICCGPAVCVPHSDAGAPSLLSNRGFPILPDRTTKRMDINRYCFAEQKSPGIRHYYWWLVSDEPLKSPRRFDGPYSKPNPVWMGEVNLV